MITITRVYEKFKVKFSNPGSGVRGFSILVKDLGDVHTVIDHYHMRPHDKEKCALCEKSK